MAIRKSAGRAREGVYTRLGRELSAGREPTQELAWEALSRLRDELAREIRRRSLWQLNPSYLGMHGHRSWAGNGEGRRSGALEELLLEAFTEIFITRRDALEGYLAEGGSIDGLVPYMVRNFVHDAHRRNDRLGARLFRLLRTAALEAVAGGRLEIVGDDSRITGGTLLRLGDGKEAPPEAARREHLEELVARWSDDLLCDLVAAPSRQVPEVAAKLTEHLANLGAEGVSLLRFGELLAAVRLDVRRRYAALFDLELGEVAWEDEGSEGWVQLCRAVEPEVEARLVAEDSMRHLIDCVAHHIETMPAPERTRGHLFRLWGFFWAFATDEAPTVPGTRAGRLPSQRKLARFLGLPRDRMPELKATLADFLSYCRSGNALEGGVS